MGDAGALLISLATAVTLLGGATAILWKPLKPMVQAVRVVFGERLQDGTHTPGIKSIAEDLVKGMADLNNKVEQVRHFVGDNHHTSTYPTLPDRIDDVHKEVLEVKSEQEVIVKKQSEIAKRQEEYHREGVARDAEQNERLDKLSGDVSGINRRGSAAVAELRRSTAVLSGRLDEHTKLCKHDGGK